MLIEEVIRILDPETTREALLPYAYDPDRRIKVVKDACGIAAASLRAQQEPNDPLTQRALDAVRAERERQYTLWGDQSENSLFEWVSILGEEYGELCEVVNETCLKNASHQERGGFENVIKEAVHVAAVAVSIVEVAYRRNPEETGRTGDTCASTGGPCCRCNPGPCDHRKPEV